VSPRESVGYQRDDHNAGAFASVRLPSQASPKNPIFGYCQTAKKAKIPKKVVALGSEDE
jgi:hypothetical protein